MSDEVSNLIIEHLRAIRSEIAGLRDDVREIKARLTSIEVGVASMKRDDAHFFGEIADQHARYDRLAERIDRIERRLEPTES